MYQKMMAEVLQLQNERSLIAQSPCKLEESSQSLDKSQNQFRLVVQAAGRIDENSQDGSGHFTKSEGKYDAQSQ